MNLFNVSYTIFKLSAASLPVYYVTKAVGYFTVCSNIQFIYISNIIDTADISDFETNIKPTASELFSEEDAMALSTLTDKFVTKRMDIQTTVIYIGTAQAGTAESAIGWTIKRLLLDASGNPTTIDITTKDTAIWDDRATETYI